MSFFRALRSKLEREPSRNFDQRMKVLIDLEMGVSPKRGYSLRSLNLRTLIPLTVSLSVVGLWFISKSDVPEVSPLAENIEFLRNLDTLKGLDEVTLTATDEEWAEILSGVDS